MMKEEILKLLKSSGIQATEEKIEIPPNPEMGDYAFPCFELAKVLKKNPNQIAEETVNKLKVWETSLIERVESKGAYINFFLNWEKISEKLLKEIISDKKYGASDFGKRKKVMIEHTQPNTNKPQHIGHGRNSVLGDSLVRIMRYAGYKVFSVTYWGDIGSQQAKAILGYKMWGQDKKPDIKPDHFIGKFYVMYNEKYPEDKEQPKVREFLQNWEKGDKKTLELWKKVTSWVLEGFHETIDRLGVKLDIELAESQFEKDSKKIIDVLLKKKIAFKSPEGAVVVDLEKYGLPSYIVLRSDETVLYSTKDLSLAVHKIQKYKLDKSIYVVGAEQKLYFEQVFKTLELLGEKGGFCHLVYGLVNLPEGKMSSRLGKVVLLDDVIDKVVDLAAKEIEKRNSGMKEKEKKSTAEKIGIGAMKYALLKVSPEKDIVFDWDKILDFEGDTGPYIQYAYTRCNSILKKAKKTKSKIKSIRLTEHERNLLKVLSRFPEVVVNSAKDMRPHNICNYANEVATKFNNFYQFCPVLKSEGNEKKFRLALVQATKNVLENSLDLIGIRVPEKM